MAKAASSARALLGPFESVGVFDSCLEGMNVLSIGDGCVTCEMVVRNELCNNYGTLHGTVSLLLKFDLIYDDLSRSDLHSAAAANAASVPPTNQTINQSTK